MPSWGRLHALLLSILVVAALAGTGCVARRRVITRKGAATPTQTLLTANRQTLLDSITQSYEAVRSFYATVDMVPALGSAEKGKVTEYKDVRAYVLYRRPSDIRIIGLYPVVRNKAFDMTSDGRTFRLYIPSRNRFITGLNQMEKPSPNKLENLRPQHFLEALLVKPVDTAKEKTILSNMTDEDNAEYILEDIEPLPSGDLRLKRQIWFDRLNLRIMRQIVYDEAGDILTDARYKDWTVFGGLLFPRTIEVNRPKDEYGVVMTVIKMEMNQQLGNDRFVLEQPEGTDLHVLGSKPN